MNYNKYGHGQSANFVYDSMEMCDLIEYGEVVGSDGHVVPEDDHEVLLQLVRPAQQLQRRQRTGERQGLQEGAAPPYPDM